MNRMQDIAPEAFIPWFEDATEDNTVREVAQFLNVTEAEVIEYLAKHWPAPTWEDGGMTKLFVAWVENVWNIDAAEGDLALAPASSDYRDDARASFAEVVNSYEHNDNDIPF